MRAPVADEPTNTIFFTALLVMADCATVWPSPASTLINPFGASPRSASRPTTIDVNGVSSEGFSSTALPIEMVGATCQRQVKTGAFHGVICKTVPADSRRV